VLDGTLASLVERVTADPNQQKGEFVVMVAGREEGEDERLAEGLRVFAILKEELPPAKAAKMAAAITGAPRKALYGS
jgi:16S rRNA (cytidine1402-2'-O)-methyltransferase